MSGCLPCDVAEARNAKVQSAWNAAKKYQIANKIESVLVAEVLRDGEGFKEGDYTHCLKGDTRLTTIFHEINELIL